MPPQNDKGTLVRLKGLPRLFRKQDAEKIAPHSAVFLSRAEKKGFIQRLNRGNYINSFLFGLAPIEEVACFLKSPGYVSCEWALHYHGLILQVPSVCTVLSLSSAVGRHRSVTYQGIRIEFSMISPRLFFGFQTIDNFNMAVAEKALLDTLYYRKGILPVEDEIELEGLDHARLMDMAGAYPATVSAVARRLIDGMD